MEKMIHATAIINEGASIGAGTRIWQYSIVMENVDIGENCNIGAYVFIEKDVKIGSRVKIKNHVSIYSGVEIEDDAFIGPNTVFTNVINPRSFIERKSEFKKTIIKQGASLGANSTILCGRTIGEYAFVGAGAVVTKDVPTHTLVVGNPAREVGYVCWCGCRLVRKNKKLVCLSCHKEYCV